MVNIVRMSAVIDEIVESVTEFCSENLIQNEDYPDLSCTNTEYNNIIKTTIGMILPKWRNHLICRDLKWHLWFEKRLSTPNAPNIIWGALVKQPNYVDFYTTEVPSSIESINSMDGGFIEASRKPMDYITKVDPL